MPRKSCESHSEGFMWNATHFSSGRQQLLHSMMCTFQPSYRGRYYFTCMLTQANPFPECFYYLIQLVQVYPDNAANAAHLALCLQPPAALEAQQKTKAVLADGETAVSRSVCDITKGCFPACVCSVFPGTESTIKKCQVRYRAATTGK